MTNPDDVIGALSPQETVALTAWAEARSRFVLKGHDKHGVFGDWLTNPLDAMRDVIEVIDNRVKDGRARWKGRDHKGICLEPYAFSCWLPHNGGDSNHDPQHLADNYEALIGRAQRLLAGETPSDTLAGCLAFADATVAGTPILPAVLPGATHYYATWISPPTWCAPPAVFVAERFGHRFYRGVR